jgi:type VI secretion system protein ImpA
MPLPITNYADPIDATSTCGEALDYDLSFLELEIAGRGKPGHELGGSVLAAEPPDWEKVHGLIQELSLKSKDLRIAVLAVRATLNRGGLEDFRRSLEGLAVYIENFWAELHPRPDSDDPDDEIVRINALADLCDTEGLLAELRSFPLSSSRSLGRFGLRHWLDAQKMPTSVERSIPEMGTIESAFKDTAEGHLCGVDGNLEAAIAAATRIDVGARQHVAAIIAMSLDPLLDVLRQMQKLVRAHMPAPVAGSSADDTVLSTAIGSQEIRNRTDITESLNRICQWYRSNEPSSPIPILLERVKRTVSMDFMSLLNELAPKGADEFRGLAGLPPEDGN